MTDQDRLIARLKGSGVTLQYAAGCLLCSQREAKQWLIDHGAHPTTRCQPAMWVIPSLERIRRAEARWNHPTTVQRN